MRPEILLSEITWSVALSTNGQTNKRLDRERNSIRLFVGHSLTGSLAESTANGANEKEGFIDVPGTFKTKSMVDE